MAKKNNLDLENFTNKLLETLKIASWAKLINIFLFIVIILQGIYINRLFSRDTVYLSFNEANVPVRAEEYDYTLVDFVDERKFITHLLYSFHVWNRHSFEDNLNELEKLLDRRTFEQHAYSIERNDYIDVIKDNKVSSSIKINNFGETRQIGENQFRITVEALKTKSVELVEDEVKIIDYQIEFIKVPLSKDNIYGFKATRVIKNIKEVVKEGEGY